MGVKVSELTAATALDGTELVPVVQDGTTKYATASQLAAATAPVAAGIYFTSAAAVIDSVGMSVSKDSTGVFIVTMDTALTQTYIISLSLQASTSLHAVWISDSSTQFTIRVFDATGAAADPGGVNFGLITPGW
jgi:hypothetical protein